MFLSPFSSSSFVLTEDKKGNERLLVFGKFTAGLHADTSVPTKVKKTWNGIVSQIVANDRCTVLLDSESGLWLSTQYDRILHRTAQSLKELTPGYYEGVKGPKLHSSSDFYRVPLISPRIRSISASEHFWVALDEEGSIWKMSNKWSAGYPKDIESPTLFPGLPPIQRVTPFNRGIIAEDMEGNLWIAGYRDQISLRDSWEMPIDDTPRKLEIKGGPLRTFLALDKYVSGTITVSIDLLHIDSRGCLSHFDSKEKTLVTAPSGSPDLVSICSARENILALDSEGGLWWAQCKEEILFKKRAFEDLQETKIAFRAIAQGGVSISRSPV